MEVEAIEVLQLQPGDVLLLKIATGATIDDKINLGSQARSILENVGKHNHVSVVIVDDDNQLERMPFKELERLYFKQRLAYERGMG